MNQLLKAVYQKDISKIGALIDGGLDVNSLDPDGRTVLMHAVLDSEPDITTIQLLLDKGVNINHQDDAQNWTALHFAARDNKKLVVSCLLNSGALVDLVDVFGNTPLWRAVMSCCDDVAIVNDLLDHGADPLKDNNSGVSPRSLAETLGKKELLALL